MNIEVLAPLTADEVNAFNLRSAWSNLRRVRGNNEGFIFRYELACLWLAQKGVCAYTDTPLTLDDYHVEHIEPMNNNGFNGLENTVLCKPQVNYKKGKLSLIEFCKLTNRDHEGLSDKFFKIIELAWDIYEALDPPQIYDIVSFSGGKRRIVSYCIDE